MSSGSGVWEPAKRAEITLEQLNRYVEIVGDEDELVLTTAMSPSLINADAILMKQQESAWEIAAELPDESLVRLIRFFTLAEMQLAGWDGGKQSPVIYLVRILKSRDAFEPELRKWIRKNSDNRYLPYGSAL